MWPIYPGSVGLLIINCTDGSPALEKHFREMGKTSNMNFSTKSIVLNWLIEILLASQLLRDAQTMFSFHLWHLNNINQTVWKHFLIPIALFFQIQLLEKHCQLSVWTLRKHVFLYIHLKQKGKGHKNWNLTQILRKTTCGNSRAEVLHVKEQGVYLPKKSIQ